MSEIFPWPWLYPYSPGAEFEIEPRGIYAGATLRFVKMFEQWPADQWTLEYGLQPYAGQLSGPITFDSKPLNNSEWHLIDVPASVTKGWLPGRYSWQCYAQASGTNPFPAARHFVGSSEIYVYPDLTQPGSIDTRTKWEKILDEVDAMVLATAGYQAHEISIGRGTIAGQTIRGWTRQDLINFRDYALHVAGNERRIRNRQGGAPNPRIKYAVMTGAGNGRAFNGFPDFPTFS